MTGTYAWAKDLEPSVADETVYIADAFAEATDQEIEVGVIPARNRGIDYIFAQRQLLVRDPYLGRVLAILDRYERDRETPEPGRPDADRARPVQPVIAGIVLLHLHPSDPSVPEALIEIDRELGEGVATPNHVLTVAGGVVAGCPATEPEEAYDKTEPYPSACQDSGGRGVLIYMTDTGLLDSTASHPWLAGVTGDPDPGDGIQPIPAYCGHGTFAAGVARCLAPGTEIIVTNEFKVAGSALESDVVPRLVAALGLGVDIFHLTMAAPSRKDLPLVAFEAWLRLVRQYKGVLCVAAAGNSDTRRPMWPAAFSEVVSVGALAADWRSRASFSNFGGWVDVYAPGRDLVNAYATGTYKCHVAPYKGQERHFHGMAKWSGTSFSAPIVTGLIAARMSRTGENGREAAAALLAQGRRQAIPGVGAILLPRCDTERCGPPERCGCGCGCGCGGGDRQRPCGC